MIHFEENIPKTPMHNAMMVDPTATTKEVTPPTATTWKEIPHERLSNKTNMIINAIIESIIKKF